MALRSSRLVGYLSVSRSQVVCSRKDHKGYIPAHMVDRSCQMLCSMKHPKGNVYLYTQWTTARVCLQSHVYWNKNAKTSYLMIVYAVQWIICYLKVIIERVRMTLLACAYLVHGTCTTVTIHSFIGEMTKVFTLYEGHSNLIFFICHVLCYNRSPEIRTLWS